MPKTQSLFVCQQCTYQSPAFLGKCPECGTWNSLVEQITTPAKNKTSFNNKPGINTSNVTQLKDVEKIHYDRVSTGISEFDRVLGGGIVKGSVVLVAGDPGIGKSTLLSQLALNIKGKSLYVAGEESAHQIKLRIDRIKKDADLAVLNEVDVDVVSGVLENIKPDLVVIDSIQTLETSDLESAAGSVSQVRESAHRLQKAAKNTHTPVFLVGHVTKEGTVAGPKTLEHLVDVVLTLEGEPGSSYRVLRSSKNRFGPVDEVGIFEMNESGLKEILNPSEVFLEERIDAPGSAITVLLTGLRPILVEIQALVTKTNSPIPRRIGTGFDNNRLQLLVAVLQKRLKLSLWEQDVFINVAGGVKISETAADLAVAAAIISSLKESSLPKNSVFIGEVGLLGEVRSVVNLEKRIKEAKRLGFKQIISPVQTKSLSPILGLLK